MQQSVVLIWIGALLVVGGVLFTAAKALGRSRLSEARSSGSSPSEQTLEPRTRNAGLSLQANWPGLALIALGFLLLLAGAVF